MRPPAGYAFLDSPVPLAFAHRGGAAAGVENALSTFRTVERLGYRYVETDVRTTADGVAVVFHDADVGRLTGTSARLAELPYAAVRELALADGEPVAPLEQVLGCFPDLRFNIDLKDEGSVRSVPDVLRRAAAQDRVCVTSFSQARIRRARRLLEARVCTGMGIGGVARFVVGASVGWGGAGGRAAVLQVPWSWRGRTLPRRAVELAHREGLAVHVWTLDDRRSMATALDLGVDGVMTDEPALLKDELVARGLWA